MTEDPGIPPGLRQEILEELDSLLAEIEGRTAVDGVGGAGRAADGSGDERSGRR